MDKLKSIVFNKKFFAAVVTIVVIVGAAYGLDLSFLNDFVTADPAFSSVG